MIRGELLIIHFMRSNISDVPKVTMCPVHLLVLFSFLIGLYHCILLFVIKMCFVKRKSNRIKIQT